MMEFSVFEMIALVKYVIDRNWSVGLRSYRAWADADRGRTHVRVDKRHVHSLREPH